MRERAVFYNSGPLEVIRLLNVALNPNVSSWKKKRACHLTSVFQW